MLSASFPDYYPCSLMCVLEQCWSCGGSLFDWFKGCNIWWVLPEEGWGLEDGNFCCSNHPSRENPGGCTSLLAMVVQAFKIQHEGKPIILVHPLKNEKKV